MFNDFVHFVRDLFGSQEFIALHEPRFVGKEKQYLEKTIDSTFVSSVGEYVDEFETKIAEFADVGYAVATVNGTSALHVALIVAGVERGDEVITQSLTFIATCNAIQYCDAEPVFVDVSKETLGLSAHAVKEFLEEYAEIRNDGFCWNKSTNKRIKACVPMHTFGFPVELDEIKQLCDQYKINLIEDAAESLGSLYKGRNTGNDGLLAILSFNGNKIITTGGGGMILTSDELLAKKAKHLTTTAKQSNTWLFEHDQVGFNYRLPNLNAALGVAQLESLPAFVESKRQLAKEYHNWGEIHGVKFVVEQPCSRANYWLNTMLTVDQEQRDGVLHYTNSHQVMTRPAWTPMHRSQPYGHCFAADMTNTDWLFQRLVNVPSSVIL